ncbi:fibronectin type III domain-containing protein [Actinoplanes sp. CA-142083]|uniref:fibronectin type III domain-containing protein n=1 Tax=Actinoplanes sp. CA-142083 TaxID=3239903 RepID=UPI003D91006C
MLTVVDARPAAAVTPSGDLSDLAMYLVSSDDVMRIGPDGNVSFPGTNFGNPGPGIVAAPDGTLYMLAQADDRVWEIAPGGSPAVLSFTTTVNSLVDIAVDDAGALYATSSGTNEIVKRPTSGPETAVPYSVPIVSAMAVDHDGSHIYLIDALDGDVVRMDADGNNSTVIADGNDIPNIQAIAVDDQQRVYVGTAGGDIHRVTQGSGLPTVDLLATGAGNVARLAVSDNGKIFAIRFGTNDVVQVHAGGVIESMVGQIPSPTGLAVRTVPAPPTTVTATAGIGSADVDWDAGQTNGGLPILRYTAVADPGGLTCTPLVPTDTDCTVSGLTDGLAYTFKVVASNTVGGNGESILSSPSNSVIPGLPAAPTSFQATPADGAADVSFIPGAPGGDPNQHFETSIDNEVSWQTLVTAPGLGGTLTGTVANLPNGLQSTILLRARTSVGNSPNASATVTAVSPSPSPSPSPSTTAPTTPPPTTTPPTTAPPTTAPPTTAPPATTPTTAPTTTPPTSATPRPARPNAPTAVTATAGTSSVLVTWQPPADNGVAITGYRAVAVPGPASCTTTGATSCVLGGTAGVSYRVFVVATSAGGVSPSSDYSNTAVPTAPAVATTPPATNVPLDTDRGQITTTKPGQDITLVGSGYAAYSTVTLTIYSTPTVLAQTRTDKHGAFRQAVTVPGDLASGEHSFTASGVDRRGKPRTMRMDVTVRPATGELPVTGTSVMWLIVTGLGLTMTGAAMRAVRR